LEDSKESDPAGTELCYGDKEDQIMVSPRLVPSEVAMKDKVVVKDPMLAHKENSLVIEQPILSLKHYKVEGSSGVGTSLN